MWLNSDDILMPNVLYFIAEQYLEKVMVFILVIVSILKRTKMEN